MSGNFKCYNVIAMIILIVISIGFVMFTYFTPRIELFKDPVTNQYGVVKSM